MQFRSDFDEGREGKTGISRRKFSPSFGVWGQRPFFIKKHFLSLKNRMYIGLLELFSSNYDDYCKKRDYL